MRNLVFALCLTSCLFTFNKPLASQQPAAPSSQESAASGKQGTQTSDQTLDANVKLLRADVRSEKKQIVAANLTLTDAEATKFWPVYNRYIADQTKLNDKRYALIKEYADKQQTMTDTEGDSLIKRWLTLDGDESQLRLRYVPEFEKVISPKKTATFFQIDRRLGMLIDLHLASQIPLVEP